MIGEQVRTWKGKVMVKSSLVKSVKRTTKASLSRDSNRVCPEAKFRALLLRQPVRCRKIVDRPYGCAFSVLRVRRFCQV